MMRLWVSLVVAVIVSSVEGTPDRTKRNAECSITCPVIRIPSEYEICGATSAESRPFESRCEMTLTNCIRGTRERFQEIHKGQCGQHTTYDTNDYEDVQFYQHYPHGSSQTNSFIVECEESRDGCGCSNQNLHVCSEGPSGEHLIFPNLCQMNCINRCYSGDNGYKIIDCQTIRRKDFI